MAMAKCTLLATAMQTDVCAGEGDHGPEGWTPGHGGHHHGAFGRADALHILRALGSVGKEGFVALQQAQSSDDDDDAPLKGAHTHGACATITSCCEGSGDSTDADEQHHECSDHHDTATHTRSDRKLRLLCGLTAAHVLAQLWVSARFGSLALLSDGIHNLSDVAALLLALYMHRLEARPLDAAARRALPHGYKRADVLGGLVNGVSLVTLCAYIFFSALPRLLRPEEVDASWLFIGIAGSGVLVNSVGVGLFWDSGGAASRPHGGGSGECDAHSSGGDGAGDLELGSMAKPHSDGCCGHSHHHHGHSAGADTAAAHSGGGGGGGAAELRSLAAHGALLESCCGGAAAAARHAVTHHRAKGRRDSDVTVLAESWHSATSACTSDDNASVCGDASAHGPNSEHCHGQAEAAAAAAALTAADARRRHRHHQRGHAKAAHAATAAAAAAAALAEQARADQQPWYAHSHSHHGHGHGGACTHAHGSGADGGGSFNIWAVLVHSAVDALSSAVICAAALVMRLAGTPGQLDWTDYLDPLVSMTLAAGTVATVWPIIARSAHILLEGTPRGLDAARVEAALRGLKGVTGVPLLAVTQLNSREPHVAMVRLEVDATARRRHSSTAAAARDVLLRFGVGTCAVEVTPVTSAAAAAAARHLHGGSRGGSCCGGGGGGGVMGHARHHTHAAEEYA